MSPFIADIEKLMFHTYLDDVQHGIDAALKEANMKPKFSMLVNYRTEDGIIRAVVVYVHSDTCVTVVVESDEFPPTARTSIVLGNEVGQFQFVTE